jgi:hypothetical protein
MITWLSARQLTVVCEQEDEVGLGRCSRHDGHSGHEQANESHLESLETHYFAIFQGIISNSDFLQCCDFARQRTEVRPLLTAFKRVLLVHCYHQTRHQKMITSTAQ